MKYYRSRIVMVCMILLIGIVANASFTFAEDAKQDSGAAATTDAADIEVLQKAFSDIEQQRAKIKELQRQVVLSEGFIKNAMEVRLDRAWIKLLTLGVSFAERVDATEGTSATHDRPRTQAIAILKSQTEVATTTIERIRARMKMPDPGLSAAELAAVSTRVFVILDTLNHAYDLQIRSLELSRQFKIDVTNEEQTLRENLAERAANSSVLLEMAMDEVIALRASVSAVPNDEELKAKLAVNARNVDSIAVGMSDVLTIMDSLDMDTVDYREQVVGATGEITAEVFDVSVGTSLLVGWGQTLWNVVIEDGPDLVFKIILFLILIYAFRKLANIVQRVVESGLKNSNLQLSELLMRMLVYLVRNVIIVIGVLIALSQVGISLGPLLAGLGVVGFVIGFALQDSLSNFASGLMILSYRPYDVGDLIETAGVFGKVSHMSLVNTTIMTLDNQTIVMPNNKIWGDVIKNITAQTLRRVDMKFGISYSDDIPKTERVLKEILDSHDKVLTDPESMVRLHELADSSVNFIVRPWVNRDDYWDVYWDVTRSVKMRFDEEGISIPFPQRDVHLHNQISQ